MKRTYNKPTLKSVNLWAAEQLMTGSNGKTYNLYSGVGNYATDNEALSNQESGHDIWGNDGSSMWK